MTAKVPRKRIGLWATESSPGPRSMRTEFKSLTQRLIRSPVRHL